MITREDVLAIEPRIIKRANNLGWLVVSTRRGFACGVIGKHEAETLAEWKRKMHRWAQDYPPRQLPQDEHYYGA